MRAETDNNSLQYRTAAGESPVHATRGMVCTSQHLAAEVGAEILRIGGNAVDAAVATAAALTVVEPTSCGVGSDAFAILWMKDKMIGLNASGRAPMGLTLEEILNRGYREMPSRGWLPVMVPGAPAAWATLSEQYGKLPLRKTLEPAIGLAEQGFAVTPVIQKLWQNSYDEYAATLTDACFEPWFETFAQKGRAPETGETFINRDLAKTLKSIAETNAESFYRGELAEKIDAFAKATGGFLRKDDLASYVPEYVKPIHASYRGHEVWELPPNGNGIAALMALRILEGFSFRREDREAEMTVHKQIEAMKLALTDSKRYVADPSYMKASVDALLADAFADSRRACITEEAIDPTPGDPFCGGTVYLCTADEEGNMVSFIQSNYKGFGSGIVIPDTGISLQDRGANFYLDPAMENAYAPGKRSFHTIIPGFLTKGGEPLGPFGVMGAFMQPQGHIQVIMNMLDFACNPQEALDAPRWQWMGEKNVLLEEGFGRETLEALRARGHHAQETSDFMEFGRGQIILRKDDGVLIGATEKRADGAAVPL